MSNLNTRSYFPLVAILDSTVTRRASLSARVGQRFGVFLFLRQWVIAEILLTSLAFALLDATSKSTANKLWGIHCMLSC
jgi:hypothetical protein